MRPRTAVSVPDDYYPGRILPRAADQQLIGFRVTAVSNEELDGSLTGKKRQIVTIAEFGLQRAIAP